MRLLLFSGALLLVLSVQADTPPSADLGSRWELFVDSLLIDNKDGVELRLHPPEKREVVLVTDAPWEDPQAGYYSVVQDDQKIRVYYRGAVPTGLDNAIDQVTCVVESTDGIHFTRPKLGLIAVKGSKQNNVIWSGIESHNFAVFLDKNPNAKPNERYKALGGISHFGTNWLGENVKPGLYAFTSPDGIHWKKLAPEPVITQGAFDSLNLAFWDAPRAHYACYSRTFINGVRDAQSSHSANFLDWSDSVPNHYDADAPLEHFYTTATIPCPGAEHLLLAFPNRFLPDRKKVDRHTDVGISDALLMTSRDGVHWDRTFREAWVRPGLDEKNWTDRNNMPAYGIVESTPDEWSLYISEHYRWPDNRLRRLSLPRHRLASVHAGANGGEFITPPLRFTGKNLFLNASTSAAGSIAVEIQTENGAPIPGFTLADTILYFGNELAAPARWKDQPSLEPLQKQPIRLRIRLIDADLFALRFAD